MALKPQSVSWGCLFICPKAPTCPIHATVVLAELGGLYDGLGLRGDPGHKCFPFLRVSQEQELEQVHRSSLHCISRAVVVVHQGVIMTDATTNDFQLLLVVFLEVLPRSLPGIESPFKSHGSTAWQREALIAAGNVF